MIPTKYLDKQVAVTQTAKASNFHRVVQITLFGQVRLTCACVSQLLCLASLGLLKPPQPPRLTHRAYSQPDAKVKRSCRYANENTRVSFIWKTFTAKINSDYRNR